MGNTDSKQALKQGIFRLSSSDPIAANDPYWRGFYDFPVSADDIFSLFTITDIRRARDASLKNVETLLLSLTTRLFLLKQHRNFPNSDVAPEKHALNCIRVLTRILPFIYEDEKLEVWEDAIFWEKRRRRKTDSQSEVLFQDPTQEKNEETEVEDYEDIRPLGEELIDTLIDLLFFVGFTVPTTDRSRNKVTYAIWQPGIGCTTAMNASKEMESNRTEVMRLLLTLTSKSLYQPPHVLPTKGVRALTYLAACPDKQIVLSLLCSQLNTVLNYNAASWRVPYDHVVYKDPKQLLVTYSLEILLTIIVYPLPENSKGIVPKNYFRHFLGRLHRLQDFEFIADGIARALNQPLQVTASYLPGSQKPLSWAPEMIMLFWETLQCNKRFRSFIIDGKRHEYMILMLFYAFEYRFDAAKQGVVRMCAFVLQTLSTEVNFAKLLNEELEGQDSLPPIIRVPDFQDSYADFLIILMDCPDNRVLTQGIFKYRKKFEALRTFTLESGQEEIERLEQRKKEAAALSQPTSPTRHSRNSSVDSLRSPPAARSPALSDVPENGAFAIGDDEDSDNETHTTPPTPPQSSPSPHTSRTTSISSTGEPLPAQLRGMSEKARGKMPAGQPSFSRQNSSTSISSYQLNPTTPTTPGIFAPTPSWIDTWLPTLPLHTILTLLSYPSPPKELPSTIDQIPPRTHFFEWTPLSLGWYESLLWGFIFQAEMVVQNGTVGVWNGSGIRLFKVQQEAARGPSLMKPMGAVDAVGTRLVSGIGNLRLRGGGAGGGSVTGNAEEDRRHSRSGTRDV
ncbi:uncharacterized protein KY384_005162 [Bacidia gigantensis]|uniref:uncharacterized protein n=1 Tax=Bacidia gigantensis TaxID=2732470 RepID=UPI001D039025|nr:uncharacterized protein KY384_005162 [Bacidia gigantensis]KAG8529681.1 hypothetical protein KY384_005162 [Bacidia gigantensis]